MALRDPLRLNLQDGFRQGWVSFDPNPPHLAPLAARPARPSGAGRALIDTNASRSAISVSRVAPTMTFALLVLRCHLLGVKSPSLRITLSSIYQYRTGMSHVEHKRRLGVPFERFVDGEGRELAMEEVRPASR